MDNTCVCCGAVIPEGRQICQSCEVEAQKMGLLNKPAIRTNGDRIRAMSDEELEDTFGSAICEMVDECNNDVDCKKCRLAWLKQEAKTCSMKMK